MADDGKTDGYGHKTSIFPHGWNDGNSPPQRWKVVVVLPKHQIANARDPFCRAPRVDRPRSLASGPGISGALIAVCSLRGAGGGRMI